MSTIRNAYITGASSGLGAELARVFARRGVRVVLAARRVERLEQLAESIRAAGGRADVAPVDAGEPEAVRAEVARWDDETGGLDLVVANAGVGESGDARALAWGSLERVLRVNAVGAIATIHAGLERMLPRGRGTLAAVSSLAAYRGFARSGTYSASKACLSAYAETLRADVRASGIRVVDVRPGFVRTEMTAGSRFPMPFLMDVEPAAARIARGIERGQALVAFPWPLWLVLGAAQALPNAVWHRMQGLIGPRSRPRRR
jgi:short-subunit dehydrogenase